MEWNMTSENVHECEFLWDIKNFFVSITQNRNFIISPMIVSSLLGDSGWNICLLLQGEADKDYSSVFLRRIKNDDGPTSVDVCFEIGLVDSSGQVCHSKSARKSFLRGGLAGHIKFVKKEEILKFHSREFEKDMITFKGRIWRPSFMDPFSEKVMVRSTLQMERANILLKMHPSKYKSKFEKEAGTVKNLKVCCTYHGRDAETGKTRLPDLSVELTKESSSWTIVGMKMSVRNKKAEHLLEERFFHRYLPGRGKRWLLPSFSDKLQDCHAFDDLNVLLEFTISDGDIENFNDVKFSEIHRDLLRALRGRHEHVLARDMDHVVFQDVFPDVYVKLGEEDASMVPAHRVVLSARSHVLRKLLVDAKTKWELSLKTLRHLVRKSVKVLEKSKVSGDKLDEAIKRSGVKVSRSGGAFVLQFPEDDDQVIKKMLSFMYTDTIHSVDFDTAMKLLGTADTYQVKGLKEWCASFLKNCITVKNANTLLLAAQNHKCVALEKELHLFIYENKDFIDYDMGRQMLLYTNVNNLIVESFD